MSKGRIAVAVEHDYDAPPEAVWRVITDHARWSEWSGLRNSHLVREGHPDPNGVGCIRGFVAGTREEVLSFDPPKCTTYTLTRSVMPMKNHIGEIRLEPRGEGTRVLWRCWFDPSIPGLGGLLRGVITKMFRNALSGLEARGFD
ncbi:MAG: SRPBCC family protein [Myxococcota bacterium]|nr:SRPBCC family protein [Myxococcota bacterium]